MQDSRMNCKAIFLILTAALATVGIIFLLFGSDSGINEKNLELLRSYGWEVEEEPVELCRLTIPEEFDEVFAVYSEMSKESGFPLESHRGKPVIRYTYRVLNHKDSGSGLIRANVFVTKDGIIAADVCSLEAKGFLQPANDSTGQIS